jgi:putative endonuclease
MNSILPPPKHPPLPHKQFVGKSGEEAAVLYLQNKKYTILDRNFRMRGGEIDIIARTEDIIVFVEVKARTSEYYGGALEAITPYKLRAVQKSAEYYLFTHPNLPYSYRIDVLAIQTDELGNALAINHLENVTM